MRNHSRGVFSENPALITTKSINDEKTGKHLMNFTSIKTDLRALSLVSAKLNIKYAMIMLILYSIKIAALVLSNEFFALDQLESILSF